MALRRNKGKFDLQSVDWKHKRNVTVFTFQSSGASFAGCIRYYFRYLNLVDHR